MLAYAIKLTRDPGGVTRDDTEALGRAGFGDRAILDICQVAAYYNYVNRLADGLGVELEEGWTDEDCTVTRAEFERCDEGRSDEGRNKGDRSEEDEALNGPGRS